MAVNITVASNLLQSICIFMWQTEIRFMIRIAKRYVLWQS